MHAAYWYQRANVASQRVSDLLRAFGFDDAHHSFLKAHIRFLAEYTDDACYVLVDDTGSTGVCDVPITKAGNHDGVVTAVMRQIAVA